MHPCTYLEYSIVPAMLCHFKSMIPQCGWITNEAVLFILPFHLAGEIMCLLILTVLCFFFKHFAKMAKFGWNVKSITRRFSPILDIHIVRMCSWLWVNWCNWFCCIMFNCWVIHPAYYANTTHQISQQPYMLRQNRLYHSVQLKMVSLVI